MAYGLVQFRLLHDGPDLILKSAFVGAESEISTLLINPPESAVQEVEPPLVANPSLHQSPATLGVGNIVTSGDDDEFTAGDRHHLIDALGNADGG